jgi:protein arginine kinase
MVETLFNKTAEWVSATGPEADVAVFTRCRLHRNLADFPFPSQCTLDERRAVEERVSGVLESLNLMATGAYFRISDLDTRDRRFLVERRLVAPGLVDIETPAGVYVCDDQGLSITINGENHLTLTCIFSGLQLNEAWARMNLLDDMLAGALDYAFSERLGYLTTSVRDVGTGFRAGVLLHLPGLSLANLLASVSEDVATKRHWIEPFPETARAAQGELHFLSHISTLGRSEEETLFHLKHLAGELIAKERETRKHIRKDAPLQIEDRVGRALGVARHARLLASAEADSLLSSLRLGVSGGMLDQFSLQQINEVFIASQDAHIEMRSGRTCDELQLNAERADLFRARFA